jgi:N-acetylmuramoyl-L-alanine amidase
MPENYPVSEGDCIGNIAHSRGFDWTTIWNHPNNAALKAKRKDPNLLFPGDIVFIPDLRVKLQASATDARHTFTVKGVPARFRIKLLTEHKDGPKTATGGGSDESGYEDPDFKTKSRTDDPMANVPFVLDVDGKLIEGVTGGDGVIDVPIPPGARSGKLTINPGTPQEKKFQCPFGSMDPIQEPSGVIRRLNNLGFFCGSGDTSSPGFKAPLSLFQENFGLPITGELDDATRAKLEEAHGS